jgi:formate hydrogenlyase subunit 3/multisubunit Na+/H+ antiporter MnhD subunit
MRDQVNWAAALSFYLLFIIGIVIFAAALVGWQTIREPKQRLNFVNLLLISMIGMNGTVLLADIFYLYNQIFQSP